MSDLIEKLGREIEKIHAKSGIHQLGDLIEILELQNNAFFEAFEADKLHPAIKIMPETIDLACGVQDRIETVVQISSEHEIANGKVYFHANIFNNRFNFLIGNDQYAAALDSLQDFRQKLEPLFESFKIRVEEYSRSIEFYGYEKADQQYESWATLIIPYKPEQMDFRAVSLLVQPSHDGIFKAHFRELGSRQSSQDAVSMAQRQKKTGAIFYVDGVGEHPFSETLLPITVYKYSGKIAERDKINLREVLYNRV